MSPVFKPRVPKRKKDEEPQYDGLLAAMQQFSHDNVLELFGGENEVSDDYQHISSKNQKLFRDWDFLPDELLEDDWKSQGENKMWD